MLLAETFQKFPIVLPEYLWKTDKIKTDLEGSNFGEEPQMEPFQNRAWFKGLRVFVHMLQVIKKRKTTHILRKAET